MVWGWDLIVENGVGTDDVAKREGKNFIRITFWRQRTVGMCM